MEILWRFKINTVEVEEPIGWDALAITMQRDSVYHGLENIFSDNITFWDNGAQIIKDAFELDGIDAELDFTSEYSCDGGVTWTFFLNGILNAFFYSVINNEVTIKIEPSGFHRKVKNRLTTPIDLESTTSIGGEAISNISPIELGLHSKEIIKYASMETNPSLIVVNDSHTFSTTPRFNRVEFPLQMVITELTQLIETVQVFNFDVPGSLGDPGTPVFAIQSDGPITFEYKIKGSLLHLCPDVNSFQFDLFIAWGSDYSQNNTVLQTAFYNNTSGGLNTIPFDYSGSISIPSGNNGKFIWLLITVSNYRNFNSSSPNPSQFELDTDLSSFIKISQQTKQDPSTAKSFLIYEAFDKLSESMTDEIDSFRSNYFGRMNSTPFSYDLDGCGGWRAITNGLNLRKMKNKNNELFPIITSFQDLFNSTNAVDNLGMRIEMDSDTGKEYIRVEPKDFFYNSSTIINLFNISDLKTSPATDLIYNNFQIGYERWNLNISKTNGIDEINSVHNYTIPIEKANNTLTVMSNYIGSGYMIEETRRQQYNQVPTNDFETDNELFFICTNVNTVNSDLYTVPPVATDYDAGTVSERDENFSSVTNLISPETAYNLRISPTRNAGNWYNYISASLYKHPTEAVKFVSAEGNYEEGDTLDNFCVEMESVLQNQNINATDLNSNNLPIYLPEYLEFTYPLSFEEFILIMNNSERAIGISCSNSLETIGFIKSLKYSPTTNGGIGEFKLIKGSCINGDYTNDFNNDFFNNEC